MGGLLHDVRAAARGLTRTPGFLLVAATTLAVAIALNGALFSIVSAVFIRPLPFASPAQLHHVRVQAAGAERFEPPPVRQVSEALAPFGEVAAYSERAYVVAMPSESSGAAEAVPGSAADERLLGVLGVRPALGRGFTAADVEAGAVATVLVSDGFWRTRLDASPHVIGRALRIDGVVHAIIGIMPAHFGFPDFAQIWVPFTQPDARLAGDVQLLLRLRDGATPEAASTALEAAIGATGHVARARIRSIVPEGGALLLVLLSAIGFVLLIACSNVANLVIARGTTRRHELAVRLALGASRATLLRYLCVEGALIALVAAATGALATVWLSDLLVAAIPTDQLPAWFHARLDWAVLGYIAAAAAVAVLVSAAMPAAALTRGDLSVTLAGAGGRTVGDAAAGRMRSTLVAVQLALAMTLLAGAALLVRSFLAVRAADPGYAAHAVLELPTSRPPLDRETDTFATDAVARLGALPGVAAVAAVTTADLPGRIVPTADPEREVGVHVEAVSASYFAALGLDVVRGRGFDDGASGRAVAVISERAARLLFDEPEAALGSSISFAGDTLPRALPVVGIAANRRARLGNAMAVADVPHVYVPLELGHARTLRLLVRSATGYPQTLGPAATATLRELDRDVVVHVPRTRADSERASSSDLRWFATVLGVFGGIAVALAGLGIWSVTAYAVSRRTREIGVRMTLGATRGRVVREMSGRIAASIGIGMGVGMLGALGIGRLLRSLLFGVGPADPVALSATLLVFALVALLATWLPASRAAAVDPQHALRAD